jgi:hypothetical protein
MQIPNMHKFFIMLHFSAFILLCFRFCSFISSVIRLIMSLNHLVGTCYTNVIKIDSHLNHLIMPKCKISNVHHLVFHYRKI